jgi:hypothetical protein
MGVFMKSQKEYKDSEWTDTIIGLMRLRAPEPTAQNWPDEEQLDGATRLAMRLSSVDLLPPQSVAANADGDVVFAWELEGSHREIVVSGDQAAFKVTRRDGTPSFAMAVSVTGNLDNVLYHWLDSWISCLG